jgi:hypothetical protein
MTNVLSLTFSFVQLKLLGIATSASVTEEIRAALLPSETFYNSVSEKADSKYTGIFWPVMQLILHFFDT